MADFAPAGRQQERTGYGGAGIYLRAEYVTTAALSRVLPRCVQRLNLRLDQDRQAIFVAMVRDGSRRVARRITRTQEAFRRRGTESLATWEFGAAPALMSTTWAVLRAMGNARLDSGVRIRSTAPAMRLARFNRMLDVADKHWFTACQARRRAALVVGLVGSSRLQHRMSRHDSKGGAWRRKDIRRPHDGPQRRVTTAQDGQLEEEALPVSRSSASLLMIALLSYQDGDRAFRRVSSGTRLFRLPSRAWSMGWLRRRRGALGRPPESVGYPTPCGGCIFAVLVH